MVQHRDGGISKISADGFEDQRISERFFKIVVIFPPAEITKIRHVRNLIGLRAGLPIEVMIPRRKRTALSSLVEPLTQSLWQAGRNIIALTDNDVRLRSVRVQVIDNRLSGRDFQIGDIGVGYT